MREQRKGSAAIVSIGYRSSKKLRDKKFVKINNLKDLENIRLSQARSDSSGSQVKENVIAIIGSVGKKKKIEIAKKSKEMKIEIYNMNPEKFLKLNTKIKNEAKKTQK